MQGWMGGSGGGDVFGLYDGGWGRTVTTKKERGDTVHKQASALRSPSGLIEMYNAVAAHSANCQDNSFVCTWRVNRWFHPAGCPWPCMDHWATLLGKTNQSAVWKPVRHKNKTNTQISFSSLLLLDYYGNTKSLHWLCTAGSWDMAVSGTKVGTLYDKRFHQLY